MTRKKWWIELITEDRPGLYLFSENDNKERERMTVRGSRGTMIYGMITYISKYTPSTTEEKKRYSQTSALVKVICSGRGVCLDKGRFEYSKSAFSKQFAGLSADDFVDSIHQELRKLHGETSSNTGSDTSTNQGATVDSVSDSSFEFSDKDDSDVSEASTSKGRKSVAKKSDSVKDIAGLRNSLKEPTTEDKYRAALTSAVIDPIVTVNLCQLISGEEYLREVSDEWVSILKCSMIKDPLYKGPPLVAIVNVTKDEFDRSKPNAYKYTVIGGCHRLKAAKQLLKEKPTARKTLEVQVYGQEISKNREAVSWWANKHNDLQNMQRTMKTQDKVKFCRAEFLKKDGNWKSRCRVMLSMKDDYLTTTILGLAGLPEDLFQQLLQVYSMYILAELKGGTLTKSELANGADCKPRHFTDFIQLMDAKCQEDLLTELINGEITMKEFGKECVDIKKRQKTQEQFVAQTNSHTWTNATRKFPAHTTCGAIDRFTKVNFKRAAPEIWNDYIANAKRFLQDKDAVLPASCYETEDHHKGYISTTNVLQLTAASAKKQFPGFTGTDLVIMRLTDEDIRNLQMIFGSIRSLNLELDKNQFMACFVLSIEKVGKVVETLREEATHVEVCYTNLTPGKLEPGKGLLHSSVEPMVVVYWSSNQTMPSPVTTIITRTSDCSNMISASTVEDIFDKILKTFSSESQWILAANLDNKATVVETALSLSRSCIQLVSSTEEKAAYGQLNSWLAKIRSEKSAAVNDEPGVSQTRMTGIEEESNEEAQTTLNSRVETSDDDEEEDDDSETILT